MRRLFLALGVVALVPLLGVGAEPEPAGKKVEAKKAEVKKADKAVIPVFRLSGTLKESPAEDTFPFGSPTSVSLKELLERLKKAKDTPEVKAVVLLPEAESVGRAQVEELRQAMKQLRDAGKDIYTHADGLSMRDYVLVAGASRVSMSPTADLWLTGLYGESPYLRGLLDKLGVEPDFLTCGAYKSAAELFMREGPSPEAEKMQNWLLDGMYDAAIKSIAAGRGMTREKVRDLIDNGPYSAARAREAGLIDAVEHREAFEAMLKKKYGTSVVFNKKFGEKEHPKIDFSSFTGILKFYGELLRGPQKKKTGKDVIAVVYVEGPIVLGGRSDSPFGDEAAARSSVLRKALDDAARDNTVKAVVLRVNSPGGSATASEIILAATKRVKARKPFVVSMGDVAASGGYYVACASDTIFADESTITGSIGVVGGKFATNAMWNKVGVTFKAYQRGKNAGILSSAHTFTKEERARMQAWMDEIYGVFKGHVVAIRGKKLQKPIDELAGGRVYTGQQALELGLVDKIGGLRDAIDHVAAQAKLTEYDVRVLPEPKPFLERLMEEATGEQEDRPGLDTRAAKASLVDLAMPYIRHLDPERVQLIRAALQRLQLLQQEGVILMMPEMRIGR
jgi:protease-4